jgi:hypothetical protein
MGEVIDFAELRGLKDALAEAQSGTAAMAARLQSLEARLSSVDTLMRPIHDSTLPLTRAKQNIGLTLQEIEKTYEYFKIAAELEGVIAAGVRGNPPEFFEAVERLNTAQEFFNHQGYMRSTASALATIESLMKRALAHCVDELDRLFRRCGKSYALVEEGFVPVNPMEPDVADKIKDLCSVLTKARQASHYSVYKSLRLASVKAELRAFEAAHEAEWTAVLNETTMPYATGNHPFAKYYELAFSIMRGEVQLWGTALPSTPDSVAVLMSICEAIMNEISKVLAPYLSVKKSSNLLKESNYFLIRLDIASIFFSEYVQMKELCSPLDKSQGSDAGSAARRSFGLDALLLMRDEISGTIIACAADLITCLQQAFQTSSSVQEALDACDLHPITSTVLCCCKELAVLPPDTYTQVLSVAAEHSVDLDELPKSLPAYEAELLQILVARLSALSVSYDKDIKISKAASTTILNNKQHAMFQGAEKEGEERIIPAKKHLFMLNNLFNISLHLRGRLAFLNSTSLTSDIARYNSVKSSKDILSSLAQSIELNVLEEQTKFCTVLARALILTSIEELHQVVESKKVHLDHSGKLLKLGDGRVLKTIFGHFNASLDTLQVLQAQWRISSTDLRDLVRRQLVALIVPAYTEFFKEYSKVNFSKKHMKEYLRYPPDLVQRTLLSLFT